jgi:hypothetical protein
MLLALHDDPPAALMQAKRLIALGAEASERLERLRREAPRKTKAQGGDVIAGFVAAAEKARPVVDALEEERRHG